MSRVHGVFEELFVVLAQFPLVLLHQLAVLVQSIGIVVLRIAGEELVSFAFGLLYDFGSQLTRQLTCLAQQHIPNVIGNHTPAFLAFLHSNDVHHGKVLDVLAERSHQRGITHARPNICHFVEQLDEQFILLHEGQVAFCLVFVDGLQIGFQVCHQTAHHATRQSGTNQQGVHQAVARADVQAKEVVHKLLDECAYLHICLHIDFGHLEACILQHGLHTEQVGMSRTPGKRLHAYVDIVATRFAHFKNTCHIETGTRMTMILDRNIGMRRLDIGHNLAQRNRTSDTCHILDADFVGTCLDKLQCHLRVVFYGMDG